MNRQPNRRSHVDNGRVWEYTLLTEIRGMNPNARLVNNAKLQRCIESYQLVTERERDRCQDAAMAVVDFLSRHDNGIQEVATLAMPADNAGTRGDPRDIILTTHENRVIGISAKNRSPEIKGPRIAKQKDFGREWFGEPLSAECRVDIRNLYAPVPGLVAQGVERWSEIAGEAHNFQKEDQFYSPALDLLVAEINRQQHNIAHLTKYFLGNHDYYLLERENGHWMAKSYNFGGTLQWGHTVRTDGTLDFVRRVANSRDTVELLTSRGWRFNLRVKNGNGGITGSLKLTVSVVATPNNLTNYQG